MRRLKKYRPTCTRKIGGKVFNFSNLFNANILNFQIKKFELYKLKKIDLHYDNKNSGLHVHICQIH